MEISNNLGVGGTSPGSPGFVESRSLGQQDFLRLMVEQMKNQNPLEPQDNSQFFTQIAQFETLDTMQEIVNALQAMASSSVLANASAIVGRTVTAELPQNVDPETGLAPEPEVVVGLVQRVAFETNGPVAYVDGRAVPMAFITEVA